MYSLIKLHSNVRVLLHIAYDTYNAINANIKRCILHFTEAKPKLYQSEGL